jgi:hypothetical protein
MPFPVPVPVPVYLPVTLPYPVDAPIYGDPLIKNLVPVPLSGKNRKIRIFFLNLQITLLQDIYSVINLVFPLGY